jgi:uncharacterized phage protein (TIGR01671 family)
MREIKFRAWDEADGIHRNQGEMSYYDIHDAIGDVSVLMQYTGLKDQNGVEIYEGDLIKLYNCETGFFQVIFRNAYVGGWILIHKKQYLSLGARKQEDLEIIGNIYENKELIK